MNKINEYLNKEMENISIQTATIDSNTKFKTIDPIVQLKEDFNIWLENLSRSMHLCQYRQVLNEIETGKKNFDLIPSEHWRYKKMQLQAIFKIIKRKLKKYSFEISKEQSKQNHSVLFWFNHSFLLLEQLILQYRDDINNIDLQSKEILKPIQFIFFGHIELLYLLINYSYINGEIQNICVYLSLVDRLSEFTGYIINIDALPLLQKLYLFRVKLCMANCDFINGFKYLKKTIDLCIEQLTLIIDYDINLDKLEKYEKDEKSLFKVNKKTIKIIDETFVNLTLAFYLRGILCENMGNVAFAIDSYKQAKYISTKFLINKYYNFTMLFKALQTNGITYLFVMDKLKELKEKKEIKEKMKKEQLERKKYFDKLNYEKNYNKYYSNINTNQDLYKGELKKFLDYAGDLLYKEEQSRHSILKKFTKTTYITSTMNMINNLLSKDFKNVLKQINKVEITKPSLEVNSLINRALNDNRQTINNEKDKKSKKKQKTKKNIFNKKTISTHYNTNADYNKSIRSIKNRKLKVNYKELFNSKSYLNIGDITFTSKKSNYPYQRPCSVNVNRAQLFLRLNNKCERIGKSRLNSPSSMRIVKNRFNKSESSLDTLDNEYSNKICNYIDNTYSISLAKNSYYLKNKSNYTMIDTKRRNIRPSSSKYYSSLEKDDKNDRYTTLLHNSKRNEKNKQIKKMKNYLKVKLKPKKEFRVDKENFNRDFINKKIFLDKYCNQEIKFHRKLLSSKSCELECTKEPIEFDLKKSKRDAELEFNKIYELCKSATNKKNIVTFIKQKNMLNTGLVGYLNLTTHSDKSKNIIYSMYQTNRENKNADRILDDEEKKMILSANEEKIEMLNIEYEQMLERENELKNRQKKLFNTFRRK